MLLKLYLIDSMVFIHGTRGRTSIDNAAQAEKEANSKSCIGSNRWMCRCRTGCPDTTRRIGYRTRKDDSNDTQKAQTLWRFIGAGFNSRVRRLRIFSRCNHALTLGSVHGASFSSFHSQQLWSFRTHMAVPLLIIKSICLLRLPVSMYMTPHLLHREPGPHGPGLQVVDSVALQ